MPLSLKSHAVIAADINTLGNSIQGSREEGETTQEEDVK